MFTYYQGEKTSLRSLTFDWANIKEDNYTTLYCFNGWGLQSRMGKMVDG